MRPRVGGLLGAVFAVFGCGGGGSSSGGSVTGSIHGAAFAIEDVVSAVVTVPNTSGGTAPPAFIVMGNTKGLCADFTANAQPKSLQGIAIELIYYDGSSLASPTATGTFTISTPPDIGSLQAIVYDDACQPVASSGAKATGGTVTLTAISGNAFSGHFDVTLDSGDHITGSFDPEACPGLQNFAHPTTPLTCK